MGDIRVLYGLRRWCQKTALQLTSDEFMSKVYFKLVLGEKLNLNHPITFNEKVQWLKLYYFPNDSLVVQCGDKYAVRDYIEKKGYGEYLNELIGTWDEVEEINWRELPNKFAMKLNHGCGYNIICDDKSRLDTDNAKKKLHKWMKEDFGLFNAEPHYSKMPRKIICEKYLGNDMIDYKFFCFHGEPKFMYIAQGFGKGENERITFFDMKGHKAPFKRGDYDEFDKEVEIPRTFSDMVKMCKILSADFPFVRVDLFEVEEKIYFSELTFTPCGGLMPVSPKEYDKIWGDMIDLIGINVKRRNNLVHI